MMWCGFELLQLSLTACLFISFITFYSLAWSLFVHYISIRIKYIGDFISGKQNMEARLVFLYRWGRCSRHWHRHFLPRCFKAKREYWSDLVIYFKRYFLFSSLQLEYFLGKNSVKEMTPFYLLTIISIIFDKLPANKMF